MLDLSQANAAGLDEAPADRTRVRLVVNRLASGSLLVKGNELPAGDDGVALLRLVEILRDGGAVLLDVQWTTDHLCSLGAVDVPRVEYLRRLRPAVDLPVDPWESYR